MKVVRNFEEFLEEGVARKITPDKQRAENLRHEAGRKFEQLQKSIKLMNIDDDNANDYLEDCYNIIMFLIRASMFDEGYSSSGQGAHEAEVAFTRKIDFKDSELQLLDQLRYFRNGILYYGKRFDKEYAEKIVKFTELIFKKFV